MSAPIVRSDIHWSVPAWCFGTRVERYSPESSQTIGKKSTERQYVSGMNPLKLFHIVNQGPHLVYTTLRYKSCDVHVGI